MTRGTTILVVDDDPAIVSGVGGLLRDVGYTVVAAGSAAQAAALLQAPTGLPGMMLLDIRMPGETGLELLARLPRPLPVPVVVLSGEASIADSVQALKLGALDFIEKPPSPERLLTAVKNALALVALGEERERLRRELARPGNILGDSAATRALRDTIAKVGPSDSAILVTGETGTGKERVARALHLASGRGGRFVAVNCAAIPAALLESELFGHERGAFTGATARHIGRVEQADGGTLLLDEIGDMPLELQGKLLRVLEEREVERVGGSAPVAVDVRVVAATHRDLGQLAKDGGFRADLYYRLNVFPLPVLPLRERADDVLPLVRAFAADLVPGVEPVVTPEAEAVLRGYPWPGNVRELRNFVERQVLLRGDGPFVIDGLSVASLAGAVGAGGAVGGAAIGDVGVDGGGGGGGTAGEGDGATLPEVAALGASSYREIVESFERRLLGEALARAGGNVAEAARLLKVDRGNLHRRIKALGVGGAAMSKQHPASD